MFNLDSINAMRTKPGNRAVKNKNKDSIYWTPSAQSLSAIVNALSLTETRTIKELMVTTEYSYGAVLRVMRNLEIANSVKIDERSTNKPIRVKLIREVDDIIGDIVHKPKRVFRHKPSKSSFDAVMSVINSHKRIQLMHLVTESGKCKDVVNNVVSCATDDGLVTRVKKHGLVFVVRVEN